MRGCARAGMVRERGGRVALQRWWSGGSVRFQRWLQREGRLPCVCLRAPKCLSFVPLKFVGRHRELQNRVLEHVTKLCLRQSRSLRVLLSLVCHCAQFSFKFLGAAAF